MESHFEFEQLAAAHVVKRRPERMREVVDEAPDEDVLRSLVDRDRVRAGIGRLELLVEDLDRMACGVPAADFVPVDPAAGLSAVQVRAGRLPVGERGDDALGDRGRGLVHILGIVASKACRAAT
jgi:hypothetical protein